SNELKRNAFRRALIRSNGLKRRTSHRSILETLESRNLMAGLPIAVNDFDFHADLSAGLVVSSSSTPKDLHTNDVEYDIDCDAIATDIAMHASRGKPLDFRTDGTLALAPEGESAIARTTTMAIL
ncbi:MAG: hypothetical protein NTU79_09310, partial [Planctomycetota bacterium]|nr:hypothetical protein [Planctomycetota bacterium]